MCASSRPRSFQGWCMTFVSLAVTTTAFGVLYSFGIFFKFWLHEWGCTRAFLSGVFSTAFLIYGLASVLMGGLTDRYGPKKTIAVGGIIMGVGALITSQIHQAWGLYITFGLMIGVGVGTSYSPTVSTISRWFGEKKGVPVGIVVSGLGLGTLVYSPLARALVDSFGWRVTYTIFGVIILSVYLVAACVLKRDPAGGRSGFGVQGEVVQNGQKEPFAPVSARLDTPRTTWDALKAREFWILFFVHCLWVLGMVIPMVHLVPYGTDRGVMPDEAALMLAFLGGVSVLGRLVFGACCERIGTKNSLLILLMMHACTMGWLILSGRSWMLWIFSLVFGFCYGALASVFPLITSEYFGLTALGSIFGLVLLGATLGGLVGPWLAGYIFDVTHQYFLGFLSGATSMVLAAALTLALPKNRRGLSNSSILSKHA
jgi:MFS family permease